MRREGRRGPLRGCWSTLSWHSGPAQQFWSPCVQSPSMWHRRPAGQTASRASVWVPLLQETGHPQGALSAVGRAFGGACQEGCVALEGSGRLLHVRGCWGFVPRWSVGTRGHTQTACSGASSGGAAWLMPRELGLGALPWGPPWRTNPGFGAQPQPRQGDSFRPGPGWAQQSLRARQERTCRTRCTAVSPGSQARRLDRGPAHVGKSERPLGQYFFCFQNKRERATFPSTQTPQLRVPATDLNPTPGTAQDRPQTRPASCPGARGGPALRGLPSWRGGEGRP